LNDYFRCVGRAGDVNRTLWFAKNVSANISLCRDAFIAVMQAAEVRKLDDPSYT